MGNAKMMELGKPVNQQPGDAQKFGVGGGVFMVGVITNHKDNEEV